MGSPDMQNLFANRGMILQAKAFHRAVFDGRPDCLKELVRWAQNHNHDFTELRNVEELDILKGTEKGLTCLQLAEQEGNMSCYNTLAPFFNVPLKEGVVSDENPREIRMAERLMPRVELVLDEDESPLRTVPLSSEHVSWSEVISAIQDMKSQPVAGHHEPNHSTLRMENLIFEDDATEKQVDTLLSEGAAMKAVQANSCTFKTDKTSLTFLKVLVGRFLSVGQAGTATAGTVDIPPRLPRKVDVASAAGNEDLTPEEEKQVDSEVAALLQQFAEVCGKFPGFIGVRNGCVNVKQRLRLSNLSVQSHAAAWAAIYATRVSDFLFFQHRTSIDADGLGEWLRHRELMPLARAVIMFFNMDYLLTSEPLDVGEAIDPTVIPFLKTTLTAWFATAPQQPGETGDDVWQRWAAQIQIDEEVMKKHLRPALDCVLESLLRMWKALDPVCKHPAIMSSKVVSVGHLVKLCVPAGILKSLPMTQQRLEKYSRNASAPSSSRKVLSLTAPTTKLKPRSS